jgi:hypothetical protein
MADGEWRVTFERGETQFDTWHWGPGKHSMRVLTDGLGGDGEAWRSVEVVYWHPGRQEVCLLRLSPYARGVAEGTMSFANGIADAVLHLDQQGGIRRELARRWTFDGPDKYHATLREASDFGVFNLLAEWDYARSMTATEPGPRTDEAAPKPSKHLGVLTSLAGSTWEAEGEWAGGEAFHSQSSFEWLPDADYVYARSIGLTGKGSPTHLLDAYFYHHTGTGALRCLALSKGGGVYEGELTVLEGGALEFDGKGYEGEQVVRYMLRFDFETDGTLQQRVWSGEDTDRKLRLDVHYNKLERKQDSHAHPGAGAKR